MCKEKYMIEGGIKMFLTLLVKTLVCSGLTMISNIQCCVDLNKQLLKNALILNKQCGVIGIPDMPLVLHHCGSSPSPPCTALLDD